MKKILVYSFMMIIPLSGFSQNMIVEVLRQIETNNKEIKTSHLETNALQIESRLGNNLQNPTVSYEHMWGSREALGKKGEFTVSQGFDFPTLYASRKKLADKKSALYSSQSALVRQQILLSAKEVCLELILLNRQNKLLVTRAENARKLMQLYHKKMATGDANVLETNKIELELLNVEAELRNNETQLAAKQLELSQLNGGVPIAFTATDYPETHTLLSYDKLYENALAANPAIRQLDQERAVAKQQIAVNKSQWLPKLELGYKYDYGNGEQFNGVTAGISIPLFENKNNVKLAKAQAMYTDMAASNAQLQLATQLRSLYDQATNLSTIVANYKKVLESQKNMELLNKALHAGNISMIEYFVEVMQLYQSIDNYYQIENNYQMVLAKLFQYSL